MNNPASILSECLKANGWTNFEVPEPLVYSDISATYANEYGTVDVTFFLDPDRFKKAFGIPTQPGNFVYVDPNQLITDNSDPPHVIGQLLHVRGSDGGRFNVDINCPIGRLGNVIVQTVSDPSFDPLSEQSNGEVPPRKSTLEPLPSGFEDAAINGGYEIVKSHFGENHLGQLYSPTGHSILIPSPDPSDNRRVNAQIWVRKSERIDDGTEKTFVAEFKDSKNINIMVPPRSREPKFEIRGQYVLAGHGFDHEFQLRLRELRREVFQRTRYFDIAGRQTELARLENDLLAVNDVPAENPELGFDIIAEEIVALVEESAADQELPPTLTIGLFGPWGAGKSTMIRALNNSFPDARYHKLEINAWRAGDGGIHTLILEEVTKDLGDRIMKAKQNELSPWTRCKKWMARLSWVPPIGIPGLILGAFFVHITGIWNWPALVGWEITDTTWRNIFTALAGCLTLAGFFLKSIVDDWFRRKFLDAAGADVAADKALTEVYSDISRLGVLAGQRLVFFIDDLDRCTPVRVAEFVESIHGLTAAGCVTIVACDEEYVSAALNARYSDIVRFHSDGEKFGHSFLEKIVQIGLRVPALDQDGLGALGFIRPTKITPSQGKENRFEGDNNNTNISVGGGHETNEHENDDPISSESELIAPDPVLISATVNDLLRLCVEPLAMTPRTVKAVSNAVRLYLRISQRLSHIEPDDKTAAERLAAFLLADRVDRVWLDAYRIGADEVTRYEIEHREGPLYAHPTLREELRKRLGDGGEALKDLYQLIGRQPRPVPVPTN